MVLACVRVLARVMVLTYVMVLACVMVFAHVMVLVREAFPYQNGQLLNNKYFIFCGGKFVQKCSTITGNHWRLQEVVKGSDNFVLIRG